MLMIAYKPHLGFCSEFFKVSVPSEKMAERVGLALALYQTFLGQNHHSQMPKARMELRRANDELVSGMDRFVNKVNNHPYWEVSDLKDLADGEDAQKWGLRVSHIPQVPSSAFHFPVQEVREAVLISDTLGLYDLYLLEKCDEMRVDYANASFVEMIDPDWSSNDPEDERWGDWFYECGDEYFDDPTEYVEFQDEELRAKQESQSEGMTP